MSQQELVKQIVDAFDALRAPYMLTGSQVSSLQGEPRSTHDVDVVAMLQAVHIKPLIEWFPAPRFYVDEEAIRDAVGRKSMFNILDTKSGDKIDVWFLKDEEYDQMRFSRRIKVSKFGVNVAVSSPEDTILFKLRWGRQLGASQKQFQDALGVYEVQKGSLDEKYMDAWAAKLGIEDALQEIRTQAEQDGI